MMRYTLDHFHLFAADAEATAAWYRDMFGVKILRSLQSNGKPRIDIDFGGLLLYLAPMPKECPSEPRAYFGPRLGLEHLGMHVEDVDAAVAELRAKGVEILDEPYNVRPDVRIAFVKGPDDARIELLCRGPSDFPAPPEELTGAPPFGVYARS